MNLEDFLSVMFDFTPLQLDQVQSVADFDTDADMFNQNHLRTILRVLQRHGYDGPFDFSAEIAHIEGLIE